ncbi:MAG: hypothetical protein AB2L14_34535 [Candidatus Xenobiia bacterium LiM19]
MLNATMDNTAKTDWKSADAAGILLHVMVDISSSMNEYAPGIGKKIDHVKKKLSEDSVLSLHESYPLQAIFSLLFSDNWSESYLFPICIKGIKRAVFINGLPIGILPQYMVMKTGIPPL